MNDRMSQHLGSDHRLRLEWGFNRRDVDAPSDKRAQDLPVFFSEWKNLGVRFVETSIYTLVTKNSDQRAQFEQALRSEVFAHPFKAVSQNEQSLKFTDLDFTPRANHKIYYLEKHFKYGVTDNQSQVLREALALIAPQATQQGEYTCLTGVRLAIELPQQVSEESITRYKDLVFHNNLIEDAGVYTATQFARPAVATNSGAKADAHQNVHNIEKILKASDDNLISQSTDRLWALNLKEMQAIQKHFNSVEREPTDVELEIIAQTWSEHCKHKIFAANINVKNERDDVTLPTRVESVFKTYIKGATDQIQTHYLESVFVDNAGVISITDDWSVAVKVETHNSPSALDPYGGALTGIVGVNRDILGVGLGASPFANVDVFCVGLLDYAKPLPDRLHHPRRILEGIRLGVEHGGNKSGVPTVSGATVQHDKFLGKPLVFCGTLGLLPRKTGKDLLTKRIHDGDAIVMIGGRIGKDGIHGATFSSLELNEESPVSAVQLGDPLTQRRVWDFLIEARDVGLYRAITDNGAGGLSSSIGELASLCGEKGGADLDVAQAKTKYPGLRAFELVVSESQERMSLAVQPERLGEFLSFAERRGVECSVLGQFKDSGEFRVRYGETVVARLDMDFLHNGCPKLELNAIVKKPKIAKQGFGIAAEITTKDSAQKTNWTKLLPQVLAHPNVKSQRSVVQAYDHEVQARTVRKPYGTAHTAAPGDGAVLRLCREDKAGIAVGLGLNPVLATLDAKAAAEIALDEAVRNVVAAGGNPAHAALIDNFCWPDPMPSAHNPDAEEKLGDLVVSCERLYAGAKAFSMPFISGKDSMKNDYRVGDVKISVPPTVLVTSVAKVPDVTRAPRGQVSAELFAGPTDKVFVYWCSAIDPVPNEFGLPRVDFHRANEFYLGIHALINSGVIKVLHDVSDGGWLTATVECLFGTRYGATLSASDYFYEPAHSFVVFVSQSNYRAFESGLKNFHIKNVGTLNESGKLSIDGDAVPIATLESHYHGMPSVQKNQESTLTTQVAPSRITNGAARKPQALVLAGDGINCHQETADAAVDGGFNAKIIHINDLLKQPQLLKHADLLALPGGFSFGDDLGSGNVLALKLKHGLKQVLPEYLAQGGLIIGICNGFQALAELNIFGPDVRLCPNEGRGFFNEWVGLNILNHQSPFLSLLKDQGITKLELPVRHGEGRLLFAHTTAAETALAQGAIPLVYERNINGSWKNAAALTAYDGRVLGLMPHPEAFWTTELHPWGDKRNVPLGTVLFSSAAQYITNSRSRNTP